MLSAVAQASSSSTSSFSFSLASSLQHHLQNVTVLLSYIIIVIIHKN
jgi:hypothetical protein